MDLKRYKLLFTKYRSKDFDVFVNEVASQSLINYILGRKDSFYRSFTVKKKNGKHRVINEPLVQLMTVQKEFSLFFLMNRNKNKHSHGFELNKSIVTNAQKHVNKNIVLNIDLENFFSNISTTRVSEFLIEKFNASEFNAKQIANLLTYKDSLPQGAPSSPVISNFICEKLDKELNNYCKEFGITYTRYADDMTFSFNFHKLPIKQVKNIISIIEHNDFKVNKNKFRYYYRNARQVVTGLVVNQKINVKREYYKNLRAIIYSWDSKGKTFAENKFFEKYGENKNFILTVEGWLNFLGQVKGQEDERFLKLKSQFIRLVKESKYVRTFNLDSSIPISIGKLKSVLGIESIKFNPLKDKNGNATVFLKHWDNERRVAIVLQQDFFLKIKDNPELSFLVNESIRNGEKGEYLMLYLRENVLVI